MWISSRTLLKVQVNVTKVFALHVNAIIAKNILLERHFQEVNCYFRFFHETGHYYRVTLFAELATPLLVLAKFVWWFVVFVRLLAVLVFPLVILVCSLVVLICPFVCPLVVLVCSLVESVCLLVVLVVLSVGLFITDQKNSLIGI